MKTYLVTTRCSFINKTFVQAASAAEAAEAHMREDLDFYQLAEPEQVLDVSEDYDSNTIVDNLREQGFW
jgi:hypothetical protein